MIDFGQTTIFGEKTISTIGYDQQEMIRDILYLHADSKMIDCDPTFSIGNFYKNGLPKPKHIFDREPQVEGVIQATSDKLPLDNNSVNVIMFDPPFVITGDTYGEAKEGSSIIAKRFTGFHDFNELKTMYSGSLKEFYRILNDDGIVIFKCQDCVSSAKNHFSHVYIMNEALRIGFYPLDLFVLLSQVRIVDGRKQQHGRKYHVFFWVFKKTKCRVDYTGKEI